MGEKGDQIVVSIRQERGAIFSERKNLATMDVKEGGGVMLFVESVETTFCFLKNFPWSGGVSRGTFLLCIPTHQRHKDVSEMPRTHFSREQNGFMSIDSGVVLKATRCSVVSYFPHSSIPRYATQN